MAERTLAGRALLCGQREPLRRPGLVESRAASLLLTWAPAVAGRAPWRVADICAVATAFFVEYL